jgi:hypothetical protein
MTRALALSLGPGGTFWGATTFATNDGRPAATRGLGFARRLVHVHERDAGRAAPGGEHVRHVGIDTVASIHTSCADDVGAACNDECGGVSVRRDELVHEPARESVPGRPCA